MSFTQLYRPDRLPTVALVQAMLNQERTRRELSVDGIFGPRTEKAIQQFQKRRGLGKRKIVDRTVWEALTQSAGFNILDSVDITETNSEYYFAGGLRKAGGRPLLVGHMCNGVGQMVHNLISAAHAARGSVVLKITLRLRLHTEPCRIGDDGPSFSVVF
jgi:hypothetical protein